MAIDTAGCYPTVAGTVMCRPGQPPLRPAARRRVPLWLTLRSLGGTFWTDQPDVYVCENPSVLIAAADVIGESSRPLVCTNGRPSAATLRLLAQLTAGGTTLHVRADDDVSGQEIVAGLRASIPNARLWRYTLRPPILRATRSRTLTCSGMT